MKNNIYGRPGLHLRTCILVFAPEEQCAIVALACEKPRKYDIETDS